MTVEVFIASEVARPNLLAVPKSSAQFLSFDGDLVWQPRRRYNTASAASLPRSSENSSAVFSDSMNWLTLIGFVT